MKQSTYINSRLPRVFKISVRVFFFPCTVCIQCQPVSAIMSSNGAIRFMALLAFLILACLSTFIYSAEATVSPNAHNIKDSLNSSLTAAEKSYKSIAYYVNW